MDVPSEEMLCKHTSRHVVESNGGEMIAVQCGLCHVVYAIRPCGACGAPTLLPKDQHCRRECAIGTCRNTTVAPRTMCRVHAPGRGACIRCLDEFEMRSNGHQYCSETCITLAARKRKEDRRGNV